MNLNPAPIVEGDGQYPVRVGYLELYNTALEFCKNPTSVNNQALMREVGSSAAILARHLKLPTIES